MDEQIKQIAERLRGLRDALSLSEENILQKTAIFRQKNTAMPNSRERYIGKYVTEDSTQIQHCIGCTNVWRRTKDEHLFYYSRWKRDINRTHQSL